MNKFEEYLLTIIVYVIECAMCIFVARLLDLDLPIFIALIALWGTIHNDVKSNNSDEK